MSAHKASTSAIPARAAAGDSGLPRANHATATAAPESPRVNRRSSNGSGAPTPILAQRGSPAHQRLPGRAVLPGHPPRRPLPHPTETLTCASSDSTLDHAFAPSDRFTLTPARP